jgi:hypothetical protein
VERREKEVRVAGRDEVRIEGDKVEGKEGIN